MRDYSHLREKLTNRSLDLNKRRQRISDDITQAHSADSSEQALERENDEVLNQLLLDAERELRNIGAALNRLREGTYGYCVRCGNPIVMPRLQIKPETAYCPNCAETHP